MFLRQNSRKSPSQSTFHDSISKNYHTKSRRASIGALQALGLNGISYPTYSQIANQKTWDLMLAAAKREKV